MPRIPVPDDYERGHIMVAGQKDLPDHRVMADIVVNRDHGRDLVIRDGSDGRYVGCRTDDVDAVREFLGVDTETPADTPQDYFDHGVCPWCDGYEGENPQAHAAQVHADEWAAYKEGET